MKKLTNVIATAVLAMGSIAAHAGSDTGLYIGGSIGQANVELSDADFNFDDSDTGFKVFGGYNFGWIPTLNIAAEVAYVDFGSQEDEVAASVNVNTEFTTLTAQGIVGFDMGPLGLFGKAGLASWDGDLNAFGGSSSESGTDPVYGLGAKIQLGSIAVRAEYEMFDIDESDIDYISVGASITF
ncbi:hypothetical protein TDB9533_01579 [Thalassocella blandensis]|nr:hypothetical protein TDB9533_01579 [Thalassocella blandensis]